MSNHYIEQQVWDVLRKLMEFNGENCIMGRRQNSPQQDDKNMLGNIGDLFVKCMRQVTKAHLYHLLGVSDYYVMYRQRAQSVL